MKIIKKISQEEMISEFLLGELNSSRFRKGSLRALEMLNYNKRIIEKPDLSNEAENKKREELLGLCRGWPDKGLFSNFPTDTQWMSAEITLNELNNSYRLKSSVNMSKKDRLLSDTAAHILSGEMVPKIDNSVINSLIKTINQGNNLPPVIIVSNKPDGKRVLIEGHSRSVAYCVAGKPKNISVIFGTSPGMDSWEYY